MALTGTIIVNLYLCNAGTPSTTLVSGGTLYIVGSLNTTASVGTYTNSVLAGAYTLSVTPPPGYEMVTCGLSDLNLVTANLAVAIRDVAAAATTVVNFYAAPLAPPPPLPTPRPMTYILQACKNRYNIPYILVGSTALVTSENLAQASTLTLGAIFADFQAGKFDISILNQLINSYLLAPFIRASGTQITVDQDKDVHILNYLVELQNYVGSTQLVTYSGVLVGYGKKIYTLQNNTLASPSFGSQNLTGLNSKILTPEAGPVASKPIDINRLLLIVNNIYNVLQNLVDGIYSIEEACKLATRLLNKIPSCEALRVAFPCTQLGGVDPLVVFNGTVATSVGNYTLAFSVKVANLPIRGLTPLLEFVTSPIPYLGALIFTPTLV